MEFSAFLGRVFNRSSLTQKLFTYSIRTKTMSTATTNSILTNGNSLFRLKESDNAKIIDKIMQTLATIDKGGDGNSLRYHQDDILSFSPDLCFFQSGSWSYPSTWQILMNKGVPDSKIVAIIQNVFDLDPVPSTLKDVMRPVCDNVLVVDKCIYNTMKRRLVNEYTLQSDGTRVLSLHDIDLPEYLRIAGLRAVPVDDVNNFQQKDVMTQQSSNNIVMVAPDAFTFNADAALDNTFINSTSNTTDVVRKTVRYEFAQLYARLVEAGVRVQLFANPEYTDTPDAVFPNNWFSTHTAFEVGESTLVLYPMKVSNRRLERRPDYIRRLLQFKNYKNIVDISQEEATSNSRFLEGTGSLVLDRVNKIAYLAISERSCLQLAQKWCSTMGYQLSPFVSRDNSGAPVYHTNVIMAIGTNVAIFCSDSLHNEVERREIHDQLSKYHEVINITWEQVLQFCGNVLEVEDNVGRKVIVMSSRAFRAFTDKQKQTMHRHVHSIIHADITTLEDIGGGGVRCTIAEIF